MADSPRVMVHMTSHHRAAQIATGTQNRTSEQEEQESAGVLGMVSGQGRGMRTASCQGQLDCRVCESKTELARQRGRVVRDWSRCGQGMPQCSGALNGREWHRQSPVSEEFLTSGLKNREFVNRMTCQWEKMSRASVKVAGVDCTPSPVSKKYSPVGEPFTPGHPCSSKYVLLEGRSQARPAQCWTISATPVLALVPSFVAE